MTSNISIVGLHPKLPFNSYWHGFIAEQLFFFFSRQYRLAAYRHVIDWGLNGELLGPGKRVSLPACIVQAIRRMYPSENYRGFAEVEDSHCLWSLVHVMNTQLYFSWKFFHCWNGSDVVHGSWKFDWVQFQIDSKPVWWPLQESILWTNMHVAQSRYDQTWNSLYM